MVNIFATALTYPAPSANYRGESELNRAVIQKVTHDRFEYPVVSPEAMRNALREILARYKLPTNRARLHDEDQLAVRFADFPRPDRYADDLIFGYLVARGQSTNKAAEEEMAKRGTPMRLDGALRMNLAMALDPYRHDALLTQSPVNRYSSWQNASSSALLHRETAVTAFQYPFALNVQDFNLDDDARPIEGVTKPGGGTYDNQGEQRKDWLRYLLRAISELNGVAGNHARSYFEMAPASIVVRVSDSLVAGYDLYPFRPDGSLPEVVDGILHDDYPGGEFHIGGKIARDILPELPKNGQAELEKRGVSLRRTARQTLNDVAKAVTGQGFLAETNGAG